MDLLKKLRRRFNGAQEQRVSHWEPQDIINFAKTKAIIGHNDEDASHLSILRNAGRLFREYIETTLKHKGHFKRVFNAHSDGYPVVDYTFDGALISLTSIRVSDKTQEYIEETKQLAGIDSDIEFWKRAIRFYTQMVIDEHYGWRHLKFGGPGGPDGGEDIFEYEDNKTGNVIYLFGNDNDELNKIAAQISFEIK